MTRFSGHELSAGVQQRLGVLEEPYRTNLVKAAEALARVTILSFPGAHRSEVKLQLRILDLVLPFPVTGEPKRP